MHLGTHREEALRFLEDSLETSLWDASTSNIRTDRIDVEWRTTANTTFDARWMKKRAAAIWRNREQNTSRLSHLSRMRTCYPHWFRQSQLRNPPSHPTRNLHHAALNKLPPNTRRPVVKAHPILPISVVDKRWKGTTGICTTVLQMCVMCVPGKKSPIDFTYATRVIDSQ